MTPDYSLMAKDFPVEIDGKIYTADYKLIGEDKTSRKKLNGTKTQKN